jgi:tetratricopeptide (TPR) repeat protein
LSHQEEIAGTNLNLRLAEALSNSGQFEEALPYFEKALKEKMEVNGLFEWALTAYQASFYETAVARFSELKKLDPSYHTLYLYLAKSYEHLEELDKALDTVKQGIREDEFNKELYLLGGKLALKKGHTDEAEKLFREAIANDPGYLEATLTLVKLFMHEERYDEVLETIENVRSYGEDDPQFDWMCAVSYQKKEQYEEALNCYKVAYTSFNNNQEFLENYGFFLIEEGDRPAAGELFSKLVEMDPANDEYQLILDRLEIDKKNM